MAPEAHVQIKWSQSAKTKLHRSQASLFQSFVYSTEYCNQLPRADHKVILNAAPNHTIRKPLIRHLAKD